MYYHVRVEKDWGLFKWYGPASKPGHIVFEYFCFTPWLEGDWTLDELHLFQNSVHDMSTAMLGPSNFIRNIGGVDISKGGLVDWLGDAGLTDPHSIAFQYRPGSLTRWTAVHELGHAWDANFGWRLSEGLEKFTHGDTPLDPLVVISKGGFCSDNKLPGCNASGYFYGGTPAAGSDKNFNRKEDFAESATAFVYPDDAQLKVRQFQFTPYRDLLYYSDYRQTARWAYISSLIQ
jgi:hypothetical protein